MEEKWTRNFEYKKYVKPYRERVDNDLRIIKKDINRELELVRWWSFVFIRELIRLVMVDYIFTFIDENETKQYSVKRKIDTFESLLEKKIYSTWRKYNYLIFISIWLANYITHQYFNDQILESDEYKKLVQFKYRDKHFENIYKLKRPTRKKILQNILNFYNDKRFSYIYSKESISKIKSKNLNDEIYEYLNQEFSKYAIDSAPWEVKKFTENFYQNHNQDIWRWSAKMIDYIISSTEIKLNDGLLLSSSFLLNQRADTIAKYFQAHKNLFPKLWSLYQDLPLKQDSERVAFVDKLKKTVWANDSIQFVLDYLLDFDSKIPCLYMKNIYTNYDGERSESITQILDKYFY